MRTVDYTELHLLKCQLWCFYMKTYLYHKAWKLTVVDIHCFFYIHQYGNNANSASVFIIVIISQVSNSCNINF